jgi:uncharacterized protein involved in exopolysaccharide biosynthesis
MTRGRDDSRDDAYDVPAMNTGAQRATLRELLAAAYFDRRRILATLLLGLLLTAGAAMLVPKRYTAEASLLLRLGREYVYTPEVGDANASQPLTYDREQTLQAEAKILTSRDVLESVVDKMGAATIYPALSQAGGSAPQQRARAVLALERAVDADLLKGSNLLQVSYRHDNAELAAQVLAQLIEGYLHKRLVVFSSASYGTAEADFAQRTAELRAAEAKIAEFKQAHGIRSFAEEQTLLLTQRNAVEQRQSDVALALAQAGGRNGALQARLPAIPSEVTLSTETQRGEAAESARKLVLDLRLKEREASAKYHDTEPAVQDARADLQRATAYLRELEAQPPRSVRTGRSALRDGAESALLNAGTELAQAQAGRQTLVQQRAALDKRLAELAASESELRTLERERHLTEVNYDAAAKRLRDETVLADLDRQRKSNVSVVQRPMVPLEAKSVRGIVLLVGGLLSVFAAVLVAFLSALWRDTFLSPAQAERALGLPTLASIPRTTP